MSDASIIYFGSTSAVGGVQRTVSASYIHPSYNSQNEHYDFMLVKLDRSALDNGYYDTNSNQWVSQPTGLTTVTLNENAAYPAQGQDLVVMGFGVTSVSGDTQVPSLHQVTVKAYSRDCPSSYSPGTVVQSGAERV